MSVSVFLCWSDYNDHNWALFGNIKIARLAFEYCSPVSFSGIQLGRLLFCCGREVAAFATQVHAAHTCAPTLTWPIAHGVIIDIDERIHMHVCNIHYAASLCWRIAPTES